MVKIQKYGRAKSKWSKTHMRAIQECINLDTEVEKEHLRTPLCRWAAKSFCLSVRLHMKRKFPMSSPDEDSPHTAHFFRQKHLHFYMKHLRCFETWKALGKRQDHTLDRTPARYRTHTPYTNTKRVGKTLGYMNRRWKFYLEPRTVTQTLVWYVATVLTITRLSLLGSIISQDSVTQGKQEKPTFRHQRRTLMRNCPASRLTDFQHPFGIWLYTYVKKHLLWP